MSISFDIEKLKEILISFNNLTNIRFVIFDENFNRILAYPEESCDFCRAIKSTDAKALCRADDKAACEICKKTNTIYRYKCHAGLIEVVAPIKMNDIVIGYIMFGQICDKGYDRGKTLEYAKQFIPDENILDAAVKKIVSKNRRQIDAAAEIMNICACYLHASDIIRSDNENIIVPLTNYIAANITGNISVDELCSLFSLSRCKLYEISHKYYGMSIAKYIRKKKIEIAIEAFREKDCTVSGAANAAGFFDYNYFSKVFKAETGKTPSEFKREL